MEKQQKNRNKTRNKNRNRNRNNNQRICHMVCKRILCVLARGLWFSDKLQRNKPHRKTSLCCASFFCIGPAQLDQIVLWQQCVSLSKRFLDIKKKSGLQLVFTDFSKKTPFPEPDNYQQLRFGVFREGVFQKMPALEGQFLKEIYVRFAGENHLRTQKNTKNKALRRGS